MIKFVILSHHWRMSLIFFYDADETLNEVSLNSLEVTELTKTAFVLLQKSFSIVSIEVCYCMKLVQYYF